METMKVKPWHESQGEYVLINVEDFDPEKHKPLDDVAAESEPPKRRGRPPKE